MDTDDYIAIALALDKKKRKNGPSVGTTDDANSDRGIVRVWMSSGGLMAQWDPLMPINYAEAERSSALGVSNDSLCAAEKDLPCNEQEEPSQDDADENSAWLGSYCSVSMSHSCCKLDCQSLLCLVSV